MEVGAAFGCGKRPSAQMGQWRILSRMPTYEYECEKCGRVFDVFHGMSESGPDACEDPDCRGRVKRLISAGSGLIFKGSGFYITDYKNKPSGSESKDKEDSGKTGDSKDKKDSSEKKSDDGKSGATESVSSAKPAKKDD